MWAAQDGGRPWAAHLARLARLKEQVASGEQDPLELNLAALVQETVEAFGAPPEGFHEQEAWLGAAGEALRLASELLAAKALRLAPAPHEPEEAEAQAQQAAAAHALDEGEPDEEGPGALEALQERALAYRRFREAARLLEMHARAWSLHQPRQAPSALLEALQRVLGPWPDGTARVAPERLVEALERVLQRTRMADRARQAPTTAFEWEALLATVRRRTAQAGAEPVELDRLLAEEGRDRTGVIGLFLAVLELVRVGELWLTEQDGRIWIRKRS